MDDKPNPYDSPQEEGSRRKSAAPWVAVTLMIVILVIATVAFAVLFGWTTPRGL